MVKFPKNNDHPPILVSVNNRKDPKMKRNAFAMICGALLAGTAIFAQDANTADLQKTAAAPEVQREFDQPDGAAIFMKPDGSFQILARGSGTYDFDDVDDINDARREATLKAKAALAKFMKEKCSSEESLENASKKVKTVSNDGNTQTANVTKESVKTTSQVIRNSADALLKGVITLKEQRIPRQGSSGEIQVTIGVSSKTLKAVAEHTRAADATPEQGQGAGAGASASAGGNGNKSETREAVTDF